MDAAPFFQRVIKLVDRHQGQLMALPVYLDGGILYYRRDLLERFQLPGPPDTWNELLSQALTVQDARCAKPIRAFTALSGRAPSTRDLSAISWNSAVPGADLCSRAAGLQLDVAANRTALNFMRDLIRQYRISPPSTYTEMKEEASASLFSGRQCPV